MLFSNKWVFWKAFITSNISKKEKQPFGYCLQLPILNHLTCLFEYTFLENVIYPTAYDVSRQGESCFRDEMTPQSSWLCAGNNTIIVNSRHRVY